MAESLPEELLRRLIGVREVAVITGAGISAESGIRTYRGAGGLYDDPAEGDAVVEALSGTTLIADPDRTWGVVAELARAAGRAQPNAAHRALAALEARVDRFALLTQNVDGLHRRAGSREPIEIHGHVFDVACTVCDHEGRLDVEALEALVGTPTCPACGAGLRPKVVLFGELLPLAAVGRIQKEFYSAPADLLLVVGTSAMFPYIVEPVHHAAARGRLTVEVDPGRTSISGLVDFHLEGPATLWVPRIVEAIGGGA